MILQLFLNLLLASVLALLIIQTEHRRVWAALLLAAGAFWAWHLWQIFPLHLHEVAVFSWIPYPHLHADLNLSTTHNLEMMVIPLGLIALALFYLNLIYPHENSRIAVNVLVLLFVAAFILLAESRDFIQLMVGSCSYTVLGFYLINQPADRQKFVFYNFLAEMALFTALAVVYSKLGVISLEQLGEYQTAGYHKDLVASLVLIVIIAKSGLFFFQNQLLDWQELTFNRVMTLSFLTTPLAGMLLFVKLQPLLLIAPFAIPLFKVILVLSLLWGFAGALAIDNIKAKALYLNLMFYSFAFAWLEHSPEVLENGIFYVMGAVAALNILLVMVNISSSNEHYVSLMGGFWRRIKLTLFLSILGVFVFIGTLCRFYTPELQNIFLPYLGLTLTVLAHIGYNIYLGSERADEKVAALLKNAGFAYGIPLFAGLTAAVWELKLYGNSWVWGLTGATILFALTGALRFLNPLADNDSLQDADWMTKIYHTVLLLPLRMLGRILWLAVDFVVIERTVIGSISETTALLVHGLQKVQSALWLNYLLMALIGFGIIIFAIGYCHA